MDDDKSAVSDYTFLKLSLYVYREKVYLQCSHWQHGKKVRTVPRDQFLPLTAVEVSFRVIPRQFPGLSNPVLEAARSR